MYLHCFDGLIHTVCALFRAFPTAASGDSIDWKDSSAETITERILKKTASGGILLFHLGKENTAEALPKIISLLKAEGYEFVTVSELLLDGDTTVDLYGVQHSVIDE